MIFTEKHASVRVLRLACDGIVFFFVLNCFKSLNLNVYCFFLAHIPYLINVINF